MAVGSPASVAAMPCSGSSSQVQTYGYFSEVIFGRNVQTSLPDNWAAINSMLDGREERSKHVWRACFPLATLKSKGKSGNKLRQARKYKSGYLVWQGCNDTVGPRFITYLRAWVRAPVQFGFASCAQGEKRQ